MLDRLADSNRDGVRREVAANASTRPQTLERIMAAGSLSEARCAAQHPSLPAGGGLAAAASDARIDLRDHAAYNPNCPPETLERIARRPRQRPGTVTGPLASKAAQHRNAGAGRGRSLWNRALPLRRVAFLLSPRAAFLAKAIRGIIRSWALTRGYALHPGTRNRYEIRYTRTQHRPPITAGQRPRPSFRHPQATAVAGDVVPP